MTTILFTIGILIIVAGFVIGIISGSLLGFIVTFTACVVAAIIYFALAKVLENQENIQYMIKNITEQLRKPIEKKICSKCGKIYDDNLSSCPYCGKRDLTNEQK